VQAVGAQIQDNLNGVPHRLERRLHLVVLEIPLFKAETADGETEEQAYQRIKSAAPVTTAPRRVCRRAREGLVPGRSP
jgi:hypothetical protein